MLGLLAIVAVAVVGPGTPTSSAVVGQAPLSLALILVLFTFGGWNEMAYVAAEVKNPSRNIVRALVLGTAAVTVLYLLVNGAYLYTLGMAGMANSNAVATDTLSAMFPRFGASIVGALICVSALGATNGLIFTGARISYALGTDHRVFRALGQWNAQTGTPVRALVLQGVVAVGLIVLLGSFVNAILYTAAAVYSFYLATSLAVVVLRLKEPNVQRPYRVTGYPLPTIVFCGVCAFLIYSAINYKPWVATGALAIFIIGLPLYWLSNRLSD
jgi:basic amino acid/polyamine antiporter, APA family